MLADVADLVETHPQDREELIALARDADAILNQDGLIDAQVIAALRHCRIIVAYGIGTDSIDVDAATARGIQVSNVPDYGLDEVATHAMTLLLAFERPIPQQAAAVSAGKWMQPPEGSSTASRAAYWALLALAALVVALLRLGVHSGWMLSALIPT